MRCSAPKHTHPHPRPPTHPPTHTPTPHTHTTHTHTHTHTPPPPHTHTQNHDSMYRGTQYYEMRRVPPKRPQCLSPLSPNDPLVYALPPIDPLSSVTQRPPISDLSPKDPDF